MVLNGDRIYISSVQYNSNTLNNEYNALLTIDTSGNVINSWCDPTNFGPFISSGFHSRIGGGWFVTRYPGIGYEESISKMNTDGNIDTTCYSTYLDIGISFVTKEIIELPDSTYLLYAYTHPGGLGNIPYENYIFLMKFRENGSIDWEESIKAQQGADTAYIVFGATSDSSGNIYMIAAVDVNQGTDHGFLAIKLNSSGNIQFSKRLNSPLMDGIYPKQMHYKNGYICCGVQYHVGASFYPGILVFDTLLNACNITNSSFPIIATTESLTSGMLSSFPIAAYSVTNDTISISAISNPISNDLCLQLFTKEILDDRNIIISPNPFQNKISICFNYVEKTLLTIFNLTGRKIFEIEITNNQYIDLSDVPPGVYLLNIHTEAKIINRKIVKL